MPSTIERSPALAYALAIVITFLAAGVRALLTPLWGEQLPLITFFPSVIAVAWLCGFGPGLVATFLGAGLAEHFWMASSLRTEGWIANVVGLLVFIAIGVFISAVVEALRQAERRQDIAVAAEHAMREEAGDARAAAARLAAIVRDSDDAIISKTLDGVITSWNPAAERLFGYTEAEAVGRPITIIVPPDRLEEERQILARLRAGDSVAHFETERSRKDGRRIPVSLTVSRVTDAAGRVVGASKIARDITEQREVEATLRAVDRQKDEFLAIVSHELRNPLAAILSAASLMSKPGVPPETQTRSLDVVRRQTEQLSRLVDDLLDVARVTNGKITLEMVPLDFAAAVAASVAAIFPPGAPLGHRLEVTVDRVWIEGDHGRIEQIVSNLVRNAVKFTPAHGTITVRVEPEGNEAVLRVKDDGIGIAPDMLPRIFGLFTQADSMPVRRHGGLGIGLALVSRLVELHGGRIEAFSAGLGRGAEFVVRLPRIPPADGSGAK